MRTLALSHVDEKTLIALEESMWREQTRFDLEFQERTFGPDFIEFGRSGRTYTRAQIIRYESSAIQATLPLQNLKLRLLDVNTVQITYDSEVIYDGSTELAHRSSIWSRTPEGWVMRFHQGTPYQPSVAMQGEKGAA